MAFTIVLLWLRIIVFALLLSISLEFEFSVPEDAEVGKSFVVRWTRTDEDPSRFEIDSSLSLSGFPMDFDTSSNSGSFDVTVNRSGSIKFKASDNFGDTLDISDEVFVTSEAPPSSTQTSTQTSTVPTITRSSSTSSTSTTATTVTDASSSLPSVSSSLPPGMLFTDTLSSLAPSTGTTGTTSAATPSGLSLSCSSQRSINRPLIIGVSIGAIAILSIGFFIVFLLRRHIRKENSKLIPVKFDLNAADIVPVSFPREALSSNPSVRKKWPLSIRRNLAPVPPDHAQRSSELPPLPPAEAAQTPQSEQSESGGAQPEGLSGRSDVSSDQDNVVVLRNRMEELMSRIEVLEGQSASTSAAGQADNSPPSYLDSRKR